MTAIKNIIFDLGGVLLNIDFNRTARAFKALGVNNFETLYSKETADRLFESLEKGHISDAEFYSAMQHYCDPGTTHKQIQDAWNAILIDFRKESIAHLSLLKERYNIYLLSNTNEIHHAAFTGIFRSQIEGNAFDDRFTKAWYSFQIDRRKPDVEIYRYVMTEGGLRPEETLFIDDAGVNIEGAKKTGMQTKLLLPDERIETLEL